MEGQAGEGPSVRPGYVGELGSNGLTSATHVTLERTHATLGRKNNAQTESHDAGSLRTETVYNSGVEIDD